MERLTRLLEILSVATLIFIFAFDTYLESHRPAHPTGRFTIQVPVHGDYIYVSYAENLLRVFSWPLFFILVVVCGGLEASNRRES